MAKNIFQDSDNNYYKIISFDALLPNLRYKNKNIYFIPKNPIKIKLNGKVEYKYDFLLENISFTGKIFCINTELNCIVIEKEDEDGLIVNIKYRDGPNIYKQDMQKFARAVEASILGIDIMDDDNSELSDTFSNYDNNHSYYANKYYDDNESINSDILDNNIANIKNDEYYVEVENFNNYD